MTAYATTGRRTRSSGITTLSVDISGAPAVPHGSGMFTPTSATVTFDPEGNYAGASIAGVIDRGSAGRSAPSVNALANGLDDAPQFLRELVASLAAELPEAVR